MQDELEKVEEYEQFFNYRYRLKKRFNAAVCFVIVFCGISAILWSVFIFHNNLINRLRYMTFDGTIFTTVTSLLCGIACMTEAKYDFEVTNRTIYFLRLSSATTEFVIFIVVVFGLSPLVPDNPDVTSYTGIMMHLIVPFLTLFSFLFNDAPIGKLKPLDPLKGSIFITIYAVVTLILFGTRILPSDLAPYSFLNFDQNSLLFKLACLVGIYAVSYSISLLLSILNAKLSWIWFERPKKLTVH